MNPIPYETHATIKLHRQALLQEAARARLLAQTPARRAPLDLLLARMGHLLIEIGTRLETRYTPASLSAVAHRAHAD